jgi:predicted glycosyltransferase involved in capsule biosynthesis
MCEITIGIIYYNRIDMIKEILDVLSKQTVLCKVIICDGGSNDIINPNNYPIINKYIWNKDIGYTRVARLNQIMNECDTKYLIYLDDDCIPQTNRFIEYYISNLKDYDVVRGKTVFHWGGDSSSWFSCSNIGFNLNKLKEIGGFDINYNGHYGHEDVDIGKMIEKAKYKISLFPEGTLTYCMD